MKDVLITGAGSGIGKATAKIFSHNEYRVFLVGRNVQKLEQTQKELTHTSVVVPCDISHPSGLSSLQEVLKKHTAHISVLVNNAGIYKMAPFAEETAEHWDWHFKTNLFAAVNLTHILWNDLKKNKGSVVNVSSTLGLRPIPGTGAYSASKAALNSWTQTLALEAGADGVRVNAICPGLVDTPIHSYHKSTDPSMMSLRKRLDNLQPLGRVGEPEEIASAIYFAATDAAKWMTGALIPIDGGVGLTTRDP
ncbi:MAG: SDR family oxidoreductase [Bdellovibrionaceae bacterium]|nr:SDR family oxidoreductase [Pseudobdellovibrionaceae bacterium]